VQHTLFLGGPIGQVRQEMCDRGGPS